MVQVQVGLPEAVNVRQVEAGRVPVGRMKADVIYAAELGAEATDLVADQAVAVVLEADAVVEEAGVEVTMHPRFLAMARFTTSLARERFMC